MPIRDACPARKQGAMPGVGFSNFSASDHQPGVAAGQLTGNSGWWLLAGDMPLSLVVLIGKTTANMFRGGKPVEYATRIAFPWVKA
jgi:hypothetical protein